MKQISNKDFAYKTLDLACTSFEVYRVGQIDCKKGICFQSACLLKVIKSLVCTLCCPGAAGHSYRHTVLFFQSNDFSTFVRQLLALCSFTKWAQDLQIENHFLCQNIRFNFPNFLLYIFWTGFKLGAHSKLLIWVEEENT